MDAKVHSTEILAFSQRESFIARHRAMIGEVMPEVVVVAHLADIKPGQMLYVDVDGLPIALANVAGTIYAFGDACRHEGGPLSSGVLRDDIVTCPWHGWAYNVRTGKALIPPVGVRVPTYPVVVDGDAIAVVIDWTDGE